MTVLNTVTTTFLARIRQSRGRAPGPIARDTALLYLAIFETLNSFDRRYESYLTPTHTPPQGAQQDVAAQAAAELILSAVGTCTTDGGGRTLEELPTDESDAAAGMGDSERFGRRIARAVLASRSNDRAEELAKPGVCRETKSPGQWRCVVFPDGSTPRPASPRWGELAPFVLADTSAVRAVVGAPPARTPADFVRREGGRYALNFDEVSREGILPPGQSPAPMDRELAAHFWSNDDDGTFKPVGHLLQFTLQVLEVCDELDLLDRARAFALVGLALADAGIAAWYAKYLSGFQLWRPVTGIRMAALDGNPATDAQPDWQPLSRRQRTFTPQFPAWVSGHATFGAAHAAVMREVLGTNRIPGGALELVTDDLVYKERAGKATRTVTSFSQAAAENADSRIYLGVHWRIDAVGGYRIGTDIGRRTAQELLQSRMLGETGT
jgi:hypothetical protein